MITTDKVSNTKYRKSFLVELLETRTELVINVRIIECPSAPKLACMHSAYDIESLTVVTDSIEVLEPFNVSEGLVSFFTRTNKESVESLFLNVNGKSIELEAH